METNTAVISQPYSSQRTFAKVEVQSRRKPHTRSFGWLKAATAALTFQTLLRHYAEQALTHGKK